MKPASVLILGLIASNLVTVGLWWRSRQAGIEFQESARATVHELAGEVNALRAKASTQLAALPASSAPIAPASDSSMAEQAAAQPVRVPTAPEIIRQSPAFAEFKAAEQRQILQRQYAALLPKLQLAPEQSARLFDLMVDLRLVPMDYLNSTEALGVSDLAPRDSVSMIRELQRPIYDEIKQLLGEDRYGEYRKYTGSLTERQTLEMMTQPLKYGDHPLTESQFDAVVNALAGLKAGTREVNGGIMPLRETPDEIETRYRAVLEQTRPALGADQAAALERIFAEDVALRRRQQAISAR